MGKFANLCQLLPQSSCSFLWQTSRQTVFETEQISGQANRVGQALAQSIRHCYLIEVLTSFRAVFVLNHSLSLSFVLQAMLDHIKHSIVSLQIAKNMAHPVNGIYNGPTVATNTTGIMMASPGSGVGGGGDGGGGGSSSSGGSGIGDKPNETHLSLKNELAGDDEDDSATENGKCHPSAYYIFFRVPFALHVVSVSI